ncbi:hypothetical protein GobsT_24810 [Gemmata obscuriglobus]|uniref:TIGR02996 domain-containing protein n=1 Tax=Gemmata obscuriglobus TaxID=114 RepID=A0A2Z3H6L9_9BACT|nr:TIGR02996 domain-containing protein [Gemmata obscuriglobus]AWM39226.1 TIGR02996 domain-containing protein [Gemmata obscuriglobus]QEG27721.1 hypothetical protein GobsT_24810 [Gemmata obscuriglobus]VTS04968.1 Repeat-companion domain TIGR02996 OS=Singulisphaera acidiphila (strain ATCC BAA-1392 / DSM 18658 / VKM B-2454 / MOB10) GN=Sinac_4455 PE=4 SV=1 [Gemmata obscuriglobus UQM 2246]
MSEREALWGAVCEHPEEDTPRLMFADWLLEHGDAADRTRAEFVRLQVGLARGQFDGPKRIAALQRVVELLSANDDRWRAEVPQVPGAYATGNYDRGLISTLRVMDQIEFRAAEAFRVVPVSHLEFARPVDPAYLAELPNLDRLGELSFVLELACPFTHLARFVAASDFRSLRRVTIGAPSLPADWEKTLEQRFGSKLARKRPPGE